MAFIITPYLDVPTAQQYFNQRLLTDPWDDASSDQQLIALIMATRLINNLKFVSVKADPNQPNEFPRWYSWNPGTVPVFVVPDEVLIATCEIAITLLDDFDLETEMGNMNNVLDRYATIHIQKDPSISSEHLRAGIPSAVAWTYLKQYLFDPGEMFLVRAT
jgi:hypothetical protein